MGQAGGLGWWAAGCLCEADWAGSETTVDVCVVGQTTGYFTSIQGGVGISV